MSDQNIRRQKNADKQARLRARRAERGIRPHTVWVPEHTIAEFNQLAELARANAQLDVVVVLRDRATGRFV